MNNTILIQMYRLFDVCFVHINYGTLKFRV